MEVASETTTQGAAPAAPVSGGSSEMTASAQASMPPQVTVSTQGEQTQTQTPAATTGKWVDSLDADLKEYVSQKGFQDPKAVIESYRNLEKLRGVPQDRLLKIPEQPDAPEWNQVYEKLGKPATPEGYNLKPSDPKNSGFTDWAKDAFHKLNLTTNQGQELVQKFNEYIQATEIQEKEQYTKTIQDQTMSLKKEWGAAFNQNVNRAQAAFRTFGIPDQAVDALEKAIGFDGTMKLMLNLGQRLGEHGYIAGENVPAGMGDNVLLAPAQAQAKIKALKADMEWQRRYLSKDLKAVHEMERLMKMAYPSD